jgi:hypothetical protein
MCKDWTSSPGRKDAVVLESIRKFSPPLPLWVSSFWVILGVYLFCGLSTVTYLDDDVEFLRTSVLVLFRYYIYIYKIYAVSVMEIKDNAVIVTL